MARAEDRLAVFEALDEVGVRTSLEELIEIVSVILNRQLDSSYGSADYSFVQRVRGEYKKINEINVDCRTYNGQPRRNMYNDEKIHDAAWEVAEKIVVGLGFDGVKSVIDLLQYFHSLENLQNFLNSELPRLTYRKQRVA